MASPDPCGPAGWERHLDVQGGERYDANLWLALRGTPTPPPTWRSGRTVRSQDSAHLLVQLQGATHGPAFLYGTSFGTSTQPDHAIVDAFSLCQIELFWKSQPASLGS